MTPANDNHRPAPSVTAERLNAALDLIAEVMILHDRPGFAPYVERLERELAALQSMDDVMTRARRRLEGRTGGAPPANDNTSKAVAPAAA